MAKFSPLQVSTQPISEVTKEQTAFVSPGVVETQPTTQSPSKAPEPEAPAASADVPAPAVASEPIKVAGLDEMASKELYEAARRENVKRDFYGRVMEARRRDLQEAPYAPPEVSEAVKNRTNEEMEAGRKAVAARAALDAARPKRPVENDGSNAVFRPNDYIPDPKKNQGHVQARTLSSA